MRPTYSALSASLAALAVCAFAVPAAHAIPEGFPNIDSFEPVTWNDYFVHSEDAEGLHVAFTTPSGLTCYLNVDAYSFECWGALHGAPAGANHVRGNVFDNQPPPEAEDAPSLLPNRGKLSWRGVTCGVDGALTACYQADHGFVLTDKESKVFPTPNAPAAPNATSAPSATPAPTTTPSS